VTTQFFQRGSHLLSVDWKVTASPDEKETFQYTPYVAYSSNGTVEGELVYANEGKPEDFLTLKEHNISLKGKIVIFRRISGDVSNNDDGDDNGDMAMIVVMHGDRLDDVMVMMMVIYTMMMAMIVVMHGDHLDDVMVMMVIYTMMVLVMHGDRLDDVMVMMVIYTMMMAMIVVMHGGRDDVMMMMAT